jgi:iron complex transport system substrate-binding protein
LYPLVKSTRYLRCRTFELLSVLMLSPFADIAFAGAVDSKLQASPLTPRNPEAHAFQVVPLKLVDDMGRTVRLDRPARRIVSLSPSITELVFEAGAGAKLVGVARHSDYPESARSIPEVGDASNLDLERIVTLKPDLVIAWRSGNAFPDVQKLEKLGLIVFATEANRLEDIPRLLRNTGYLSGTFPQAEASASRFEEALSEIRHRYVNRPKLKVFQMVWHQPLMTINRHHLMSDIIEMCGGVNIFASSPFLTPVISVEDLLEANPEVIISSLSHKGAEIEVKARMSRFPSMTAIRHNHMYSIHPDLLHRQTSRLIEGARAVCARMENARSTRADEATARGSARAGA